MESGVPRQVRARNWFEVLAAASALSWCAGAQGGAPAVDIAFDALSLTFAPGDADDTWLVSGSAANNPVLQTSGWVRRAHPQREALFDTGFVSEPNPADVRLRFEVPRRGVETQSELPGWVTIVDVDGDELTFQGMGTLVLFDDGRMQVVQSFSGVSVASDEGTFDGSDGGSVLTDGFGGFFGSLWLDFRLPSVRAEFMPTMSGVAGTLRGEAYAPGRVVPTPGSTMVLALGFGLAVAKPRRGWR